MIPVARQVFARTVSGMRRRSAVSAVVALCLVTGCSMTRTLSPAQSSGSAGVTRVGLTRYAPGQRISLPPITAKDWAGATLNLTAASPMVTVINVWASWCAPCRDESPVLGRLWRQSGSHVHFIGLDETDVHSAAARFAASAGTGYTQVSDPDSALLVKLKVLPTVGIPSTLVLDRQGRVAGRVVGPVTAVELQSLISDATSS